LGAPSSEPRFSLFAIHKIGATFELGTGGGKRSANNRSAAEEAIVIAFSRGVIRRPDVLRLRRGLRARPRLAGRNCRLYDDPEARAAPDDGR